MIALSLLLGAAAGVSAMIGREISAVELTPNSFFCAEDCVHEGVYFSSLGNYCLEKDIIVNVNANGEDQIDEATGNALDCRGAKLVSGATGVRQFSNAEKDLYKCDVENATEPSDFACYSFKSAGFAGITVKWADIAKELKSTTRQGTPQENKPTPEKSEEECAKIGKQVFDKCRETREFAECEKEGADWILKCRLTSGSDLWSEPDLSRRRR
ncbi:uncharacterized protein BBA_09402 [Beauveria bassiana ARSEF 2860]|uniref:Uncharacterized protein n=1 Tax=Beauveria bassiana (strain ARSEF 2860) TaxID=655819 RepID=J4VSR3_BEAB2|nr:uncharacterized protein BBA_09402 [Beauveria bassiana ARSEF 2860]EJP61630.1 hypothetical protein BBA_09402 [Beauveria bassiana ARSEF 2860]